MSHTAKNILKRARQLRNTSNLHSHTKLSVLILVETTAGGLPNIAAELSRQDNEDNLDVVVSERSALTLELVRGLTIMAIVDHLTAPLEGKALLASLHNATVTAQVALGRSYEDLVY